MSVRASVLTIISPFDYSSCALLLLYVNYLNGLFAAGDGHDPRQGQPRRGQEGRVTQHCPYPHPHQPTLKCLPILGKQNNLFLLKKAYLDLNSEGISIIEFSSHARVTTAA